MSRDSLVSVIMPVYNGERYISQAVESILNQTYKDFELIIVNDGSTDNTKEILKKYSKIQVINQENQGVAAASNNGIVQANGKYIARLDADDIAFPERLEIQIKYLEKNPQIGILGSSAIIIDDQNREWGRQKMPLSNNEIRWVSLFKSPFIHSSVIIRRDFINKFPKVYDQNFAPSDDYFLWIHLLQKCIGENMIDPMISYRVHSKGATATANQKIKENSKIISINAFMNFLPQALEHFLPNEINQVQEILFSGTRGYRSFGEKRVQLVNNYLSIWDIFMNNYSFSPEEKKRIQDQVIVKVCQMTFYPPWDNESNEIIDRLNRMDKNWSFIFLRSLPYASQAFIRERLIWKRI